jgi:hypothetical protein
MTRSDVLVSTVVALLCAGILTVFTDIEIPVLNWFRCGPFASLEARQLPRCR